MVASLPLAKGLASPARLFAKGSWDADSFWPGVGSTSVIDRVSEAVCRGWMRLGGGRNKL